MATGRAARRRALLGLIAAIAIGAVAAVTYLERERGPVIEPRPTHQWFDDLATRQLFVVPRAEVPPINAPSGKPGADGSPGGVKAHVFSCGSCADEQGRFVGYLETFSLDAVAAMESMRRAAPGETPMPQGVGMQAVVQGRLVKTADATEWVTATSKDGREVVTGVGEQCDRGKPVECYPANPK